MTLQFGFELEGFVVKDSLITIPPPISVLDIPLDGMPGLVEARTVGGENLFKQIGCLVGEMFRISVIAEEKGFEVDWGKQNTNSQGKKSLR